MNPNSSGSIQPAALLVFALVACFSNLARGQATAPVLTPSPSPTYTINLSPPNQVGQKFGLVTDVSQKIQMKVDARLIGISALNTDIVQETATHFEAEGEILAVFPNGGIKKIALTVTSLQSTSDGKSVADLPAKGAKIVAEVPDKKEMPAIPAAPKIIRGDKGRQTVVPAASEAAIEPKPTITIDGVPASDAVASLLSDMLQLDHGDHTIQDEYGPTTPEAVGDTWPVNTALLFEELNHGKGDASSTKGAMKLDNVEGLGDDQVVTVSGHSSGDGIRPPLPSDVSIDSFAASFINSMTRSVPATRTKGVEKRTTTTTMKLQIHLSKLLVMSASVNGTMQMKASSEFTYDADRPNPAHDLELDQDNASAYISRGHAKEIKGDYAGAIADLTHALELDPKNALTYDNRGFTKDSAGDYDGAIADFDKAIELNPKNAGIYYDNRGYAKENKGDYDGAIADFNHAIELNPKDPDFYSDRGDTEAAKDEGDAAIADYSHVIELGSKDAVTAYKNRGVIRQIQGDSTGALADYDQAIELKPDDSPYSHLYRQILLMKLGKAPTDFAQTVANWKDGWSKTASLFVAGGLDETALLAAAEKSGEEPVSGQQCEACYFIGMMRLLKGDQTGARDFFQKSLATGKKDYPEYQFARSELARLEAAQTK